MTDEQIKKCIQIWWHYGPENQIKKTKEELTELLIEVEHMIKGEHDITNLIDEIADVSIMVKQISYVIGEQAIKDRIDFKLDRELNRIRDNREA